MNIEELRELCTLTVELTKLRQAECKHLCIENFAPELLGKLIREHMGIVSQFPPVQPATVQPRWVPEPAWQPTWTITCGGPL